MIQSTFCGRIPASRGFRMLAVAAMAALALSACSGGGGGGGSAGGGPVVSGGGGAVFSLTAGGVRLHIQEGGGDAANLNVTEGTVRHPGRIRRTMP